MDRPVCKSSLDTINNDHAREGMVNALLTVTMLVRIPVQESGLPIILPAGIIGASAYRETVINNGTAKTRSAGETNFLHVINSSPMAYGPFLARTLPPLRYVPLLTTALPKESGNLFQCSESRLS